MYMLAAGAAAGAMNAVASLKDLFTQSSSSAPTNTPVPADPFAIGSGSSDPSAPSGTNWSCMTPQTMSTMIAMQSQSDATTGAASDASSGAASPGGGRAALFMSMLDRKGGCCVRKDELTEALTPR